MMNRLLACVLCVTCGLTAHATDWSKKLPQQWKSRYFTFHYQREAWDAAGFGRFADAFVDLINRDFVKVEFDYPIQVLVLPDRTGFQQFPEKGVRRQGSSELLVFIPGVQSLRHLRRIRSGNLRPRNHAPIVDRNLRDCPMWASEAIPAFFEKFIGYWDGDSWWPNGATRIHGASRQSVTN